MLADTPLPSPTPLVSVIIPTKDRPVAVVDAVASIFAGSYQNFDIWTIDQSADDATRDALAHFGTDPRFHYHTNRKPGYGAASSRNLGIVLSDGEIVAFIDDDVEVQHDWMARIVAEFTADPALQFVCGNLIAPPYDSTQGFTPATDMRGAKGWAATIIASGANFSMRRSLFERVGGYDEFCGPGSRLRASDDGDISFRIIRSGAKWKGCPEIAVVHTHGLRLATDARLLLKRYQHGVGGNFGRFTRRGDILAGLWYMGRQTAVVGRAFGSVVRGQRPVGLGWVAEGLRGFWHGLTLPPNEGFVGPAELARRRALRAETSLHPALHTTEPALSSPDTGAINHV